MEVKKVEWIVEMDGERKEEEEAPRQGIFV